MMTLIILFAMLKAYFKAVFQTIHKLLLDYAIIILFCARVLEIF